MSFSIWLQCGVVATTAYAGLVVLLAVVTGIQHGSRWRCRRRDREAKRLVDDYLEHLNPTCAAPRRAREAAAVVSRATVSRLSAAEILEVARRVQQGRVDIGSKRFDPLADALRQRALCILKQGLASSDRGLAPWTRRRLKASLRALGLMPTEDLVPSLVCAATTRDRGVAAEALAVLGMGATANEAATVVLASRCRLNGAEGPVRVVATWALGRILEQHPRNASWLARDPSPWVRRLAVQAAADCIARPAPATGVAREIIRRGLRDDDVNVRSVALQALLELELDEDGLDWRRALDDLELATEVADLDHPLARWAMARAGAGVRDVVDQLLELLDGASARRRNLVAGIFTRLVTSSYERPVIASLVSAAERRWPQNRQGLEALGYIPSRGGAHVLVRTLDAEPVELRRRTADALASLARALFPKKLGRSVVEQILERLTDEDDTATAISLAEAAAYSAGESAARRLIARMPSAPRVLRGRLLEALALSGFLQSVARSGSSRAVLVDG